MLKKIKKIWNIGLRNFYNIFLWGFIIYTIILLFIYLYFIYKNSILLYILGYYSIFVIFFIIKKYYYWLYFNYRYFIKDKINFSKVFLLKIYNGIFYIFLGILILTFIYLHYFYFSINFTNLEKIFSFIYLKYYKFFIVILVMFFIRNISFFIKIIFKYFATWTTFFFILFLMIISGSNYYLNYLGINNYLGIIFSFIILFGMFKIYFLVNFDNYKKGYFFNIYKKAYNYIINSNEFKNNLSQIELESDKYKQIYNTYKRVIKEFNENIIIKGNFIEPISDKPIGMGNDIFGNDNFAKNIYDILNGINFKEFEKSYSIGIVGEWGGGKSSIINLLNEQYLDGNPNFQVLKFNPWDYKTDKLINSFFGELSKILGVKDVSNLFKNYLKLVGNIDSNIKIGINFLSEFIGSKSLEKIKKEIDEKLKDYGRKIVIIIDDLDRCEPVEVLMMLNLIKNLGDFNNIIYLVSYDKEHIIKVLEDKKFSGDYIEKIINIERFISVSDKEQLKIYFKEKFNEILKNLKKDNNEKFNEEKRNKIIEFLMKEFDEFFEKENLRFIKKLLNHLNIILQLNLEKESSEIENLSKEDFRNIFIINYIKLKDFKWFNFILNKINNYSNRLIYKKPNRPSLLLNLSEKYLYNSFINFLEYNIIEDGYHDDAISFYRQDSNQHKMKIEFLKKYS